MKFDDFLPQDRSPNGPRRAQDGSKRFPKTNIFHVDFCLRFWTVLGPILGRFWEPLDPKIGPKSNQKSSKKLAAATYPQQTTPRGPKSTPRPPKRPQDPPKKPPRPSQEAIRGIQDRPRLLQVTSGMLQDSLNGWNFSPKGFVWFCNCIPWPFCLHLQCKCRNLSKGRQEAPKSFPKSNVIAWELLSLQASECLPPNASAGFAKRKQFLKIS